MAGTQTMTITVMYQTSDTYVYIIICWSSFKGCQYRACPYFYFSVEWWNGCWQCSVEARQWIWRLLALVLWLLFAQCHLVSCHIMHSFQPCVSNRIVVLLLIIQQLHSVLIVILTCVNLIDTNHYTNIGWPAEHTHKKLMIHDNQISRELVPLCLAVHQKIAVAACSFNIQLCPCPCPWASSAKHILRARLTMKCTEVDKESHRDKQGSTQRSTRDDIEVARKHTKGDKGAHRGKQQCT